MEGKFDEIAKEVITPIMDRVYEVAFEYMVHEPIDGEPKIIPMNVREGVLEKLNEAIEHLESRASYYKSASIIGYALGKDGMKPARQSESMAKIVIALRDLIKAKDDQIQEELSSMRERTERDLIASGLGF